MMPGSPPVSVVSVAVISEMPFTLRESVELTTVNRNADPMGRKLLRVYDPSVV